jgi:hypothetical protein
MDKGAKKSSQDEQTHNNTVRHGIFLAGSMYRLSLRFKRLTPPSTARRASCPMSAHCNFTCYSVLVSLSKQGSRRLQAPAKTDYRL